MDFLDNKKVLSFFTFFIFIVTTLLKIISLYLQKYGVIANYDYVNPAFGFFISLPFLVILYILILREKKYKLNVFDYILYFLILIGIIATIFAVKPYISIFGKEYRHEGLISLICYYLLFINWEKIGDKEDYKKIINFLVWMGIFNSIYSLFQIYTKYDFIIRYSNDRKMASGLCGNPNFLGSFIVIVLSIVTCKFFMDDKIRFRDILFNILFFITLVNCESTGPFLSYVITVVFLIVFLIIKKRLKLKNVLILALILASTFFVVEGVNKIIAEKEKSYFRCEMCDVETYTIKTGGTHRIMIWENSLNIAKDNFLIGVGYDNFEYVYPNPVVYYKTIVDKKTNERMKVVDKVRVYDNAHNVYLHNLICNGIFGLIAYLLLCLLVFIIGLRSTDVIVLMLLAGFVGYSISAFANISVIQIAPIYYVIMGLIASSRNKSV